MEAADGTRTLRIDGMHDAHCEERVRAALRDVPGITTESVRVHGAVIRCQGREGSAAACAALNAAGFKAWETRPLRDRNAASRPNGGAHETPSATPP